MLDGTQGRVCTIDRAGGDVIIRLRATNALRAGADFALLGPDGATQRDRWKMATGDTGTSDHTLTSPGLPVSSLDGNTLKWEVLCCSTVPGLEQGAADVIVLQSGAACPSIPPAHWDLTNVPNCATGKATPINASLVFRFK